MKKNYHLKKIATFIFLLLICNISSAQLLKYVGFTNNGIPYFQAEQNTPQWCWAASSQMVLNKSGITLQQNQIINRIYTADALGNLPDWNSTYIAIHYNMDGWNIKKSGKIRTINAYFQMGLPSTEDLITSLQNKQPLIMHYRPDGLPSHPVVVIGAYYLASNDKPILQSLIIKDPWNTNTSQFNNGNTELPATAFFQRIRGYWILRVH